jgi:hypothetical protein
MSKVKKPAAARTGKKATATKKQSVDSVAVDTKADKNVDISQVPESQPKWYETYARKAGRVIAVSSLPEIFMVSTYIMARWIKNSDFSYPSEMILAIVMFAVLVSIVFYGYKFIFRGRLLPAHISALLLSYGLYGFSYSFPRFHGWGEAILPSNLTEFTSTILMVIFLALLFGVIGFAVDLLKRKVRPLRTVPLLKVGLFAVCFIFAVQVIKVGSRLWTIRHDLTYHAPSLQVGKADAAKADGTKAIGHKPNVYYLLFDRYANDTTLKNVYDYDNTPFLDFLSGQGFVNRKDAYSNYPFTMQSISSTVSMAYHTELGKQFRNDSKDFQTSYPYRTLISEPPVAEVLKQNGYQYNQVSSWWDFTRNVPAADTEPSESFRLRVMGKNFWLTDLQRDIQNKSVFGPLLRKGMTFGHTAVIKYQLDRNPQENFYAQMDALKQIARGSSKQDKPQFTFAHVLSPHDPYVFDANGNKPWYNGDRTDWDVDETVKYTNQVHYINTQIQPTIETIRQQDPTAVIVVQADEGPYPKEFRGELTPDHYYDPINLQLPQQRQKFGVLASYYMPGVDKETVAKELDSSVNAFRFVLNHYLGYDMAMLPDCHFTAGDKFTLYTYGDVTGKLEGTPDQTVCAQYK